MGYHVYHSQLSCLTPVSGELKTVTHMANMRPNGASLPKQQPLSENRKITCTLKEGVNKADINVNIQPVVRGVMMVKVKHLIILTLSARNYVFIL